MTHSSVPPGDAPNWLEIGRKALEKHEYEVATNALRQAIQDPVTRLAAHNLIERHSLPGAFAQMFGLNCEISPADDIFKFFEGHATCTNPLRDYLADGWRTLSELMVLLETIDRPLLKEPSFLEFACGHGRFTRHAVKTLGASRVTVADVVPSAVDFSKATFGVEGFYSAAAPEAVNWPKQYDVVFVLSLFSHLPKSTWARWLKVLYQALKPGGLLVFSTHGVWAAERDKVTLDAEGFYFAPSSESQAIDVHEYGTAFTSTSFVEAQIWEHLGEDALLHSAPVHFWHHQDAYVVHRA